MAIFLVTDGMTFAGLLFAWADLRAKAGWAHAAGRPSVAVAAAMTAVLLLSSVSAVTAVRRARGGDGRGAAGALLLSAAGGALFLLGQAIEWTHLLRAGFTLPSGNFPAAFFVITGFHGLHVAAGVAILLLVAAAGRRGRDAARNVEIAGLFWNFVDAVWIVIFAVVYVLG
jgi:heme/copper-type cytochrome/quinol oxidase subunit 3